jgi:hypothetical protein
LTGSRLVLGDHAEQVLVVFHKVRDAQTKRGVGEQVLVDARPSRAEARLTLHVVAREGGATVVRRSFPRHGTGSAEQLADGGRLGGVGNTCTDRQRVCSMS